MQGMAACISPACGGLCRPEVGVPLPARQRADQRSAVPSRRFMRHGDCLPSGCDAGFGCAGSRPALAVHYGSGAGNPSRPRGHARRPRRRLPRLPDRLGTLEGRHSGPRVRGLCAVYVRAAAGGRTGPAAERAVLRAHLCGVRAAGGAKVFPSNPAAHPDRPRPARRSVRPRTPPSSGRAGSSRPAAPLRPAFPVQAPEYGAHSGAGTPRVRCCGGARRQPGRRRRPLHGESPDRKSETARLLPHASGTGRRFPRRSRPQKSPPAPVKSRVPRYERGDCDRMGFRS